MPSRTSHSAILAAAGSRKTERIIDAALSMPDRRVLITTYTTSNQDQIVSRLEKKAGCVPRHIAVMGWFSFLIDQCARPYQRALTNEVFAINGMNFKGARGRYTKKAHLSYFVDRNGDLYRDGVSDFVVTLNARTGGAVIRRLENIFTDVFIDEVQDLVGYDLDFLDLLMASRVRLHLVGDHRQHTFSTNLGPRHRRYRGIGLLEWFQERRGVCALEQVTECYRCCQLICDFADRIYPNLPATTSVGVAQNSHQGVFQVCSDDVHHYVADFPSVTVLRYDKNTNTMKLAAINIGVVKGSTFERVMVFPTKPMLTFLIDGDPEKLTSREKLYVAVTRAQFSVAFVVPKPLPSVVPLYRSAAWPPGAPNPSAEEPRR